MRAARIGYSSEQTGSSLFEIERSNHGELKFGPTSYDDAHSIQWIGREAWANSDWMIQIAEQLGTASEELARLVFDPNSTDKINAQSMRVIQSELMGRRVVYWFGMAVADIRQWPRARERQGFVKVGQDGSSNNLLIRTGQRIARKGIYACLHDLNVLPAEQGKGFGTALAYAGLADQPKRMKSSLYVAANNDPMRAWAEKYGYTVTDEYKDPNTIPGVNLEMVRYQAPSVGRVMEKMEESRPWLADASRVSMLGLVLEHE